MQGLFKIELRSISTESYQLQHDNFDNTPGTRGWSRLRDRTLSVHKKTRENKFFFRKQKLPKLFLDIPSSYAKIKGETNCQ